MCVLLGWSVPVVLRANPEPLHHAVLRLVRGGSKPDMGYSFIGDCYEEYIMQGSLLDGLERDEVTLQYLHLK